MLGQPFRFGAQPAESRSKRTCGTRAAGLRRAEAAARSAFSRPKFKIQDSKFKIMESVRDLQRNRPSGLADAKCGPSPGEAVARQSLHD